MKSRRRTRVAALLVAGSLIAAACGGDDSSDNAGATAPGSTASTGTTAAPTTATPQTGGQVVFASFSEPASLDPIVSTGNGTTGATEMAAVYDTLMRFNPTEGKYEPRTAESVTSTADFMEWTVKIKPNIKFSDGTPYDAEAVRFGLNRHRVGAGTIPTSECAAYFACPRNGTSSGVYMALIKDIVVTDPLTIKITMNEAWSALPYALSDEPSMIPSKAALQKACTDPTKNINTCTEFGLKPVGAGPFVVESFKAKESIVMNRNPTYWDGPVYLDSFKIVSINDQGGEKSYDAFKGGTAQMAYLRTPATVAAAKEAKDLGFGETLHGGGLILMNMGVPVTCAKEQPAPLCTGKPDGPTPSNPITKNLKVRQAVAAALDPKVIDQRANGGKGSPGSALLQSDFRWYPDVPGPAFDLAKAKQLVSEVKAETGWDGKIRMLYSNGQFAVDVALATEAMLRAAGMDPIVDTSKDTTAQVVQVSTTKDFELSGWGTSITSDDGAIPALGQNLSSTSTSNRVGYSNPKVDQALKDARAAKDDTAKKAAMKVIVEEVNKDLPMLAWSKIDAYIVRSPKVNGVVQNHSGVFFMYDAWLAK